MNQLKHVAIIMDGNGRWAKQRLRPRIWGHVRGSGIVSDIVQAADDAGVKALTLYAFSTENWSRPLEEVTILFRLLRKFLLREKSRILKNNIKFRVIGDWSTLPSETVKLVQEMEELTKDANGLMLTFAFGYGARKEILSAVNAFQKQNPDKEMTESDMDAFLYRPEAGQVDLMIRTGGDLRISNFLLWQIAYAELFFTNTKWPDFTVSEFVSILDKVGSRERRFGNVSSQSNLHETTETAEKNKSNYLKGSTTDV